MKIAINQSRFEKLIADREFTYQEPLELGQTCKKCKEQTTLMMLIDDDEWLIAKQRPEQARIWPHDCTVIAIYLCTHCGSMRAKWNQG